MSSKRHQGKRKKEDEATAQAFEEFIKTFQNSSEPPPKIFVRSGVLHPQSNQQDIKCNQIYHPQAIIKHQSSVTLKNAIECARFVKDNKVAKGKGREKPKTNLELLKEEIRLRHLERNETSLKNPLKNNPLLSLSQTTTESTNLFVYNLTLNIKEPDLMQLFGAYGPLASVKIMWPRTENEIRTANCGFVAFMSRKDSERALKHLMGYEGIQIEWGKPVEIPPHPIYIPPRLLKQLLPPPFTGLPFNAQSSKPISPTQLDQLENCVVKVTIPWDKKILATIHRMIEFVVREGPQFEATIMTKEINNPTYSFLFDMKGTHHIYYRWKLYSILHGESTKSWSSKCFRMYKTGSIWIPPTLPDYTQGMPEELIPTNTIDKNLLSESQKIRLVETIRNVTLRNDTIATAMAFCLSHANASKDILEILIDSFQNESTKPTKKIGRLYVISDILYNAYVRKSHFSVYVGKLESHLETVFYQLYLCMQRLSNPLDVDAYKTRVLKILSLWELWSVYPARLLHKWKNVFLNVNHRECEEIKPVLETIPSPPRVVKEVEEPKAFVGFIPSKWETIDPEQVEASAMSTQKLYELEQKRLVVEHKQVISNQRVKRISERKRKLLRQIEVMVIEYQDKLETGQVRLNKGTTLEKELDEYRSHLLKKLGRDETSSSSTSSDSSDDEKYYKTRSRYKKRSKRV